MNVRQMMQMQLRATNVQSTTTMSNDAVVMVTCDVIVLAGCVLLAHLF